jgi:hypothetical protein
MHATTKRHTQGIGLKYRPTSYFWATDHHIPLLSDIKGAERRKLYEHSLEQGQTDLDPDLLQHALREEQRQALGRIHPNFLGGEFLPSTRGREVEIARITIASTTQDVTCVYARQVGQRIQYRVVDEYNGDTLDGKGTRTSTRPLTLEQLVDFFLKSWNLIGCLDCNFGDDGHPRNRIHRFVVDASSSFYAEFGDLVHARIDEWLDTIVETDEQSDTMFDMGDSNE